MGGNALALAGEVGNAATFTSTAAAGLGLASLTIGGNVRTVAANAQGAWSYTLTPDDIAAMGQGDETLYAKAIDAAGNVSHQSEELLITIAVWS
jgi:hypothetical protein